MRVVLNYGRHQDKHFKGLYMENNPFVIEKFNFTFPPTSNFGVTKIQRVVSCKCEYHYKAVIS